MSLARMWNAHASNASLLATAPAAGAGSELQSLGAGAHFVDVETSAGLESFAWTTREPLQAQPVAWQSKHSR
jgi:hypothetical protein